MSTKSGSRFTMGILSAATAAAIIVACGFNLGSYGSEVVRGAVLAIRKEQHEAAVALNYTAYQRYRYVIIL